VEWNQPSSFGRDQLMISSWRTPIKAPEPDSASIFRKREFTEWLTAEVEVAAWAGDGSAWKICWLRWHFTLYNGLGVA
jgi:hypothetical protein